jgi:hypothetical protein
MIQERKNTFQKGIPQLVPGDTQCPHDEPDAMAPWSTEQTHLPLKWGVVEVLLGQVVVLHATTQKAKQNK